MKTKAAVLYEANSPLVVEELDLDPPKEGEVLVKVGAAGICRSDWHFMAGESFMPLPAVLGHEGSGVVQEVGPGVTSLKPGDPVILSFVSRCGRCHFCTIGRPNLCDVHMATSTTMLDGTYRLHKARRTLRPCRSWHVSRSTRWCLRWPACPARRSSPWTRRRSSAAA